MKIRRGVAAVAAIGVIGAIGAPASSAREPYRATPDSFSLSADRSRTVRAHLPRGTYTQVCFDVVFGTDQLDPGESLYFTLDNGSSYVALNDGDLAFAGTSWCYSRWQTYDDVTPFEDGRAAVAFTMLGTGSLDVLRINVSAS